MISECLHDINEDTEIEKFYNQTTPGVNLEQPLLIFKDKLIKQNKEIKNYNLNNEKYKNKYIRDVDIESDLFRINLTRDKCYNDNYKMSHKEGPFIQHSNIYDKQETLMNDIKNKSKQSLNNKLPLSPNCLPKKDRFYFETCANKTPLPSNHNQGLNSNTNQPVYYRFNNQDYCKDFPCQRLFHNITKRSMLPANNTRPDINPDFLSCCNIDK